MSPKDWGEAAALQHHALSDQAELANNIYGSPGACGGVDQALVAASLIGVTKKALLVEEAGRTERGASKCLTYVFQQGSRSQLKRHSIMICTTSKHQAYNEQICIPLARSSRWPCPKG